MTRFKIPLPKLPKINGSAIRRLISLEIKRQHKYAFYIHLFCLSECNRDFSSPTIVKLRQLSCFHGRK
jgi:hypothetical protein